MIARIAGPWLGLDTSACNDGRVEASQARHLQQTAVPILRRAGACLEFFQPRGVINASFAAAVISCNDFLLLPMLLSQRRDASGKHTGRCNTVQKNTRCLLSEPNADFHRTAHSIDRSSVAFGALQDGTGSLQLGQLQLR